MPLIVRFLFTALALNAAASAYCACDPGNGDISLPQGFCATVFADKLGGTRHITVSPEGDVYANSQHAGGGGAIIALRDADHDGHAEIIKRFGSSRKGGTGIAVHDGALYVEDGANIVRYTLTSGELAPLGPPKIILSGLPQSGDHTAHPFTINGDNALYVDLGSATNACQEKNRERESVGRDPCPELSLRAGIWRYAANMPAQKHSADKRFALGARNALALAELNHVLYAVIQGRDQLDDNWPKIYDARANDELPAEVLVRVDSGDDLGWPYCYYDGAASKYVLAPEYGGDGHQTGRCVNEKAPLVAFPAHWAPMALVFYSGARFPEHYRGGAFVSFHGSWNRQKIQSGFLVAFVPFKDGKPSGAYEEFATRFAANPAPASPKQAAHRPVGLAVAPDGALFVSDDVTGRIWRIAPAEG